MRVIIRIFLLKRFIRRPLRALRVIWPAKRAKRFHPSDCLDMETGFWNRTTIQDLAELEIHGSNRHWSRVSVVLISMRELNPNDRPNDCLRNLERALRRFARPKTHLVGRWSRREFVVCLPDIDHLGAFELVASAKSSVPFDHGISSYELPLDPRVDLVKMVREAEEDMLGEDIWQPLIC